MICLQQLAVVLLLHGMMPSHNLVQVTATSENGTSIATDTTDTEAEYELYSNGAAGICPDGKALTKQECLQAAREVGSSTMTLRDTLNVGSWVFTPCGCFIYINHWVDYKSPLNGNCVPDSKSNLVCRKEATALPPEPVTDYELYTDGAAGSCPDGQEVSMEECMDAVEEVVRVDDMDLKRDMLHVGSWDHTPCGCFVYDDYFVDFKSRENGNCLSDPRSNLVCRRGSHRCDTFPRY